MKIKILLTLFLFLLCADLTPCLAQDYEVYMTETDNEEDEDSGVDDRVIVDPVGPRSTSKPWICSIDKEEGISIPGVDVSEIYSYEIRDAYGNTVAVFADEASFIETLFSLRGEYRLIFRLPGKSLVGWISL